MLSKRLRHTYTKVGHHHEPIRSSLFELFSLLRPVWPRCFTTSTQFHPRGRSPLVFVWFVNFRFCALDNCSFLTFWLFIWPSPDCATPESSITCRREQSTSFPWRRPQRCMRSRTTTFIGMIEMVFLWNLPQGLSKRKRFYFKNCGIP